MGGVEAPRRGVYLLRGDAMPKAERVLLMAAARAVLSGSAASSPIS